MILSGKLIGLLLECQGRVTFSVHLSSLTQKAYYNEAAEIPKRLTGSSRKRLDFYGPFVSQDRLLGLLPEALGRIEILGEGDGRVQVL
ncbi:hypothetical protein CDAR_79361 [Caerostris darwini]|uniref:Uncharacterized protein n=1 Tax=Caerostris darwini TaxID=1538125 RepID=A0AAV4RMT8_9ARAC|nr:hypothetical protein CDAR_79361 [Caerostris darwini]